MARTLLICEDNTEAREFANFLEQEQHEVDVIYSSFLDRIMCEESPDYAQIIFYCRNQPETVLSDCRHYRISGGKEPLMVVLVEDNPDFESVLLDAGVDDCLLSTSYRDELPTRLRLLQIRRQAGLTGVIKIRDLELDCQSARVTRCGSEIPLTRKEFEILNLLMKYPNKSFTSETILRRVWDSSSNSTVATVRTHVKTLRRKIGDFGDDGLIKTTRGWGYKVVDDCPVS
ncbi:MAG: response regulator transcription factor [Candidatus Obscuribacterales bacterium]|nr:response regulator transcription factor [Candidatus Obscuribacterales bacterium]